MGEMEALKARIEYLEQGSRWYMDAMNMLILMSEGYGKREKTRDALTILKETASYITTIVDFDMIAFFLVNEDDFGFELSFDVQNKKLVDIEELKVSLIEAGEFAWAISQNRTIEIESSLIDRKLLMHVLTTKNRVRGMFVGVPASESPLNVAAQNLISVVLQNCAHTLEGSALYDLVTKKNQQLEEANSHLERKVGEKTKDLHEALVRAEDATKAKSLFLANMSHEIRTPLNAITGFSHLLLQQQMPPEQHDQVEHIRIAGDQLLSLINDILDFSKVEAGKLAIEQTPFNLLHMLDELKSVMEFSANEKSIPLRFDIPDGLRHHLEGDPHRLKQIITNLLSNAIKFTHDGEVSLSVSQTSDHDQQLVYTEFRVSDTGIGMTASQAEKLFQSFSQSDASTTRKYGGTGLGLAISQQLARLMGSEITVSSEYGVGSVFTLTLPFKCIDSTVVRSEEEKFTERTSDEKLKLLEGRRILLVEDNEVNQMVATAILKRFNLSVTLAHNGQEAVEMANRDNFDLILMDIQMPVMDGYDATRKIREHLPATEFPIIAMTADAISGVEAACLDAGMNGYLTKPINVEALKRTLIRWLHM
jgi:signal transduction histidine kinase/BarA-like signal transduction histidine kinase